MVSYDLLSAFTLSFLLLGTFLTVNAIKPSSEYVLKDTKVVMFSSVFRHGDRTPDAFELDTFPNSVHNKSIYFPSGLGQLTNVGKARSHASGQNLRRRYNGLLNPLYLVDEIRMRTTDYDRTKMTGMMVYAGLYPPQCSQIWNSNLNWQPIPFDTPSLADDDFMAFSSCPTYINLVSAQNSGLEAARVMNIYSDTIAKLSEFSGADITKLMQVFSLQQVLLAQIGVGRTVPTWAVKLLPKINEICDVAFPLMYYGTEELITLAGGRLLDEILTNMEAAAKDGSPTRRAYLYSAHDLNIGALMAASGICAKNRPPATSMFTLELRKKISTGEYGVVALYSLKPEEEPEILLVPGCPQVFCPLDTFAAIASQHAITKEEYKELCAISR